MTAIDSPSEAPAAPRGTKLPFALVVVAVAVALFALNFAVIGLVVDPEDPYRPTPQLFAACVAVELSWFFIMVKGLLGAVGGLSLRSLGWSWPPSRRELAEGLVGLGAALLALLAINVAAGEAAPEVVRSWLLDATLAERALWLVIGLGYPFVEESAFRGCLQPALTRKVGVVAAVIITAVIFSLYHLPKSPLQFAGRCATGLVFATLRARTQKLNAPYLAHALVWLIVGVR